jgi:monoamine oxidase
MLKRLNFCRWPVPDFRSTSVDTDTDLIILGAGVAGLAAARKPSSAGLRIDIVEARDRIGGRIHSVHDGVGSLPVEGGAEFVHGRPPETWEILRAAQLAPFDVPQNAWTIDGDRLTQDEKSWDRIEAVMGKMKKVEKDISFRDLAENCCKGDEDSFRLAMGYVEGFNAADAKLISVQALLREEKVEEEIEGDLLFRVAGGYDGLVRCLRDGCDPQRVRLRTSTTATRVRWRSGQVEVSVRPTNLGADTAQTILRAKRCLITLPLGVLKATAGEAGAIALDPDPPTIRDAINRLEMGPVLKAVLQFREPFWESLSKDVADDPEKARDMGFLLAVTADRDVAFPTWWTALPMRVPRLTAWAGGPAAMRLSGRDEHEILELALADLAATFKRPACELASLLDWARVFDWQADPFTRGAYSYVPVGGLNAPDILATPVERTLYFAGEATHAPMAGTVAGAIASGYRAAEQILNDLL